MAMAGSMLIEKCADEKEWLEKRLSGIGGSEASCLLGRNPYLNNQKLYDLKTGKIKALDISNVAEVRKGKEAEAPLRELFKLDYPQYQVTHNEHTIYRNMDYPFIFGSFDGTIFDPSTTTLGILEIKTTKILNSMHKEKWNDRVPDNYFIQVLHYLLVSGFSFAILKARFETNYQGEIRVNVRHYYIDRAAHEQDIEVLKKAEIKFWTENVMKGIRPSLLLPNI